MLPIIPTPKSANDSGEILQYQATITPSENFRSAVDVFCEYAERLGIKFTCTLAGRISIKPDSSLQSGAYRLIADENGITLLASDATGANHAFATLLQIIKYEESTAEYIMVPGCTVTDYADCSYRGLMVDLARNWHDFSYLFSYVDMCYFYKVAYLHLHFTDDQSYTLPSNLFPRLSTEGRHYTFAQITEFTAYAHARGIELVPEIDVPGHCVCFQCSYPEIFGSTGIICFHQNSIEAMQLLFCELCDMFPYSGYIHIGGDEAEIQKWSQCPECMKYVKSLGIDTSVEDERLLAEHMYATYVNTIAEGIFAKGRTPIVWEGFAKEVNHLVSKSILLMSWENYYQTTPDLLEAGFKIVNCSWKPMYVVPPDAVESQREVFDWTIYKWTPIHTKSPYYGTTLEISPTEQVIGGQLHAWGDMLARSHSAVAKSVYTERELLIERLPMLAENTWNRAKTLSFADFMKKYERLGGCLNRILAQYM